MSEIAPVVRHMLLCEEVRRDPARRGRFDVLGIYSSIRAGATYPVRLPDVSVFVMFTGGRGEGTVNVALRDADADEVVFEGPGEPFTPHADPLRVRMLQLLLRGAAVRRPGLY